MKRTKAIITTISLCVLLLSSVTLVSAQKKKFDHAVARSEAAGKIIKLLALTPESGMLKDLIDKAEAIGVFPKVEKQTVMFSTTSIGYGVISSRVTDGWTMPAFYQFGGGGFGSPFAKNDTFAIILLFMTKDAVAGFEKGGVKLKADKKAIAGPVGAVTEDQLKEFSDAHIIAYAYYNGDLKGVTFGKSAWQNFALNPDNNINKPLYGAKGREVLSDKKIDSATLPAGISAYQEALQIYYANSE